MSWEKLIHSGNINTEEHTLTRDSITTNLPLPGSKMRFLRTAADGTLEWSIAQTHQHIDIGFRTLANVSEKGYLMHSSTTAMTPWYYGWSEGMTHDGGAFPSTLQIDMDATSLYDISVTHGYVVSQSTLLKFQGYGWCDKNEAWKLGFYHVEPDYSVGHVTGNLIETEMTCSAMEDEIIELEYDFNSLSVADGDVIIPVTMRPVSSMVTGNTKCAINGYIQALISL